MERLTNKGKRQSFRQRIWPAMLLLLLSLTFLGPWGGCARVRVYPPFPMPNEHVVKTLDDLSEKDADVKSWLNRLRVLCIQLGTCKE